MKEEQRQVVLKTVYKFGHFLDNLVVVGAIFIALIGLYALWDSKQVYTGASSQQYEIYKPSDKESIGFNELQDINPDVIAWITEYGTGIDYPVVQGKDNFEYLNKNSKGKYSLAGSIFMDYRNHSDFSDSVSILYGHHMSYDAMFGDIDKFASDGYLESHKYGNLFYNGKTYGLENFAYIETTAYDGSVYRIDVNSLTLVGYKDSLMQKSLHSIPIELNENDRLVLLSTCASGYTDARQILVARITDTVQENTFPNTNLKTGVPDFDFTNTGEWHQIPIFVCIVFLVLLILAIMMTELRRRRKMRID